MAIEGFSLQAGEVPAELDRRARYALLQRGASVGSIAGGLVGEGDLAITIGTGLQIKIAAGECFVPGSSSATQSGYYILNSASLAKSIAAANETNPRIDRVVARVFDAAYTGAENKFEIEVLTGTPTSGANLTNLSGAAAQPTSSLTIGYVEVKAKGTTPSGVSTVAPPVSLSSSAAMAAVATRLTSYKAYAGPATLASGELAVQNKSGETFTLPAVGTANQVIEAVCGSGATSAKVTTSGGALIYGAGFVAAAATIGLTSNQTVRLQSNGTAWIITGGEPKRETSYTAPTARVMGTEYEPSAARDVQVSVYIEGSALNESLGMLVKCNGVEIAALTTAAITGHISAAAYNFRCPAGAKWVAGTLFGAPNLSSSYYVL
jgi:hypothetical protein